MVDIDSGEDTCGSGRRVDVCDMGGIVCTSACFVRPDNPMKIDP